LKLTQVDVRGDEKLDLLQQRQVLLAPRAFDDHGDLGGMEVPDLGDLLDAEGCNEKAT